MNRGSRRDRGPRGKAAFRIGCSGWQYKHWKGDFYTSDLPQRGWLEYYARHFDTVEVNRRVITARFTYVRFHGATGRYNGAYPAEALQEWAEWLTASNVPAFVYFNNDIGGHAPRDAKTLRNLLTARQHLDRSRMDRNVPMAIG